MRLEPVQSLKIWVDLDNSPHVPLFVPIVEELRKRDYSVLVTARDCFQVCALADMLNLSYRRIGRHHGRNTLLKVAGLCTRALQLAPAVLREKPDLALSHGSRSQLIASALLGIPSVVMIDYEFARGLGALKPTWLIAPEVIPDSAIPLNKSAVFRYPGIKEDVYVPRFTPEPGILGELGLRDGELLATVRPPATEAHYHVPESDVLYHEAITFLGASPAVKIVLLPRNNRQEVYARKTWPALFDSGKIVVPGRAVDGLNLIWHSDLVISGGGTMNREAAALGVPVYSIFRGGIGAVDRYLAQTGRLAMIERAEEVRTRIVLTRRPRSASLPGTANLALHTIVDHIVNLMESRCAAPQYNVQ
jgi:predicted glycosyltransferase